MMTDRLRYPFADVDVIRYCGGGGGGAQCREDVCENFDPTRSGRRRTDAALRTSAETLKFTAALN